MSLRPLGWMATLVLSLGALYLSWLRPDLALPLLLSAAGAAALGVLLLTLLDLAQRRDLDPRQRATWALVLLLALPPLASIVYLGLGRLRTVRIFRHAPFEEPPRRAHPSPYRVRDPFHRG